MSKDEDHSSDIFGQHKGSPRSALRLVDHISRYTKTELTYQSDVMNAMRGLFASFAKATPSVQQWWGIPTSAEGYNPVADEVDEYDYDFGHASYIGTICHGLLWTPRSSSSITRREGFPSWSWVGWVGPIEWPQLNRSKDLDVPIRISAVGYDGSWEPMTKDTVRRGLSQKTTDPSICPYLLRLEAEILSVRFVNVDNHVTEEGRTRPGPTYAAISSLITGMGRHYWHFRPTPSVHDNDDVHRVLCQETLDCIVLSHHQGLVVYQRHGVAERIGLIGLHSWESLQGPHCKIQDARRHPHLRDFFPGRKQEVVLG
jgi:hypothetical protein